jgi:hypothetical protein
VAWAKEEENIKNPATSTIKKNFTVTFIFLSILAVLLNKFTTLYTDSF